MKILGSGGGGGKGGGGGSVRAPVEAPDSLRSIQYAKVIDLLSEGEIEGLVDGLKSVYLNDTPVQNANGTYNFSNVIFDSRVGTQAQAYMAGFGGAESETIIGTEVTTAIPVVRTVTNTENTAVRVTLGFPQLTSQNTTTGDLLGTSVEIAIDVQNNGGGYVAQALRTIYQSSVFASNAGVFRNTVASTSFNITVNWTGESIAAPQTCAIKLQYRVYGSGTWLDYGTHTFSGGTFAVQSVVNGGGSGGQIPSGSKVFNVALASNTYEFQVVKTGGSLSRESYSAIYGYTSLPPLTGVAYGGTSIITQAEAYAPAYTDVISGKCTSRYQRAYRIELPAGGAWDIRVRRITADSGLATLQNKTFFDALTEIVDAKFRYPNSAYVGLKIDSKQFNSIPTRRYDIKGIKVKIPSNYDPLTRAYTGTWDGTFTTAWTDNPAWVFYDIVTNSRYGLGEFVAESQVDKWALYTIAQYCDVMVPDGYGGIEPRFTCNLYLQTREEAYKVLANMASIFRGVAYWSAGEITVSQDAPSDAVQLFTPANIVDGKFSYSGSSGKVRHTVVLVAWNDPQDGYRQKIEYVADDDGITRYGVVQTEVVAIGCTSVGQAHRVGKWILYTEINETETITFTAGLDTVFCPVGGIIKTQDPLRAGKRFGGRTLTGSTTSSIAIDSAVTIESGKTYELNCIMPDGTVETKAVTNAAGSTSTLTVSPAFSAIPLDYSIWVLAANDLVHESWRVVSIAEVDKTKLQITALTYNQNKYLAVEQDLILQPIPTSVITTAQPAQVINLQVSESLYLAALSTVATKATVSWNTSTGANSYTLQYTKENQNPVVIDNITGNSIDIEPIQEGNYTFSVFAVNALGRRSQATTVSVTINGKTTPPNDVTNLQVAPLGSIGLFTWDVASDLDVVVGGNVKFRYSPDTAATWDTAFDLAQFISGSSTTISLPLQAGIYLAKFEDSTGNLSTNATSIITNAANIIALNFVELVQGNPSWTGTKTNTQYYPALSGLVLSSADLWDSADLMDSDELMDFGGGVYSSGTYALGSIDLGSVKTSRVSASLTAQGVDMIDTWDSDELMDALDLVDGTIVNDVSSAIYVRTTNDDPAGTPTWSSYQPLSLADISARAFEFELRLSTASTFHNVIVSEASATVDMPDLIQSGDDIVSGTTTKHITFATPFQVIPAIGITAQNMATGDYYTITNKSVTGFDIDFYNASATHISRTFDHIEKGY